MESQARTWGMLCHLTALAGYFIPLGNLIGPLVVWLIKKNDFAFVDEQGKESLNFQISMTLYAILSGILIMAFIGIILLVAVALVNIIFVIIASVKTSEGQSYRYPLTIRFIH